MMTRFTHPRRSAAALLQLVGGLGTSLLFLLALLWLGLAQVLSLVGVGLLLLPGALGACHAVARYERHRLGRWGVDVVEPGPLPAGTRAALGDLQVRRELTWLAGQATVGLLCCLLAVLLPIQGVRDMTLPIWWNRVPDGTYPSATFWTVESWRGAWLAAPTGLLCVAFAALVAPWLSRRLAARGRRLLSPPPGTDLPLRIAQLTATRAAALDAHAVELRRIERSLHDSTQNPLVAVTVLIGAARRALQRNPSQVDELLGQAQTAAEHALSELQTVARTAQGGPREPAVPSPVSTARGGPRELAARPAVSRARGPAAGQHRAAVETRRTSPECRLGTSDSTTGGPANRTARVAVEPTSWYLLLGEDGRRRDGRRGCQPQAGRLVEHVDVLRIGDRSADDGADRRVGAGLRANDEAVTVFRGAVDE